MTREHVFPRWLTGSPRFVNLTGEVKETRWWPAFTAPGSEKVLFESNAVDLEAKIVCEQCNTVWMRKLEDAAKRRMGPMILGHKRILGRKDRIAIARWSMKTACVVRHCQDDVRAHVPLELRRAVFRGGLPDNVFVWLGAIVPSGIDWGMYTTFISPPSRPLRFVGSEDTIRLGQLLIKGITMNGPGDTRIGMTAQLLRCLIPLWPIRKREPGYVWPPPAIVRPNGWTWFSQQLMQGGIKVDHPLLRSSN